MKNYFAHVALLIGFAVGCSGCPQPFPPVPPGPPPSSPDAAVAITDADVSDAPAALSDCEVACENLYNAGCPEATKHGKTVCVDTCEKVQTTRFINLDVKCLMKAETAYAVQQCGVKCPNR